MLACIAFLQKMFDFERVLESTKFSMFYYKLVIHFIQTTSQISHAFKKQPLQSSMCTFNPLKHVNVMSTEDYSYKKQNVKQVGNYMNVPISCCVSNMHNPISPCFYKLLLMRHQQCIVNILKKY